MAKRTIGTIGLVFMLGFASGGVGLADVSAGAYLAGRQATSDHNFSQAASYFTKALVRDQSNATLLESTVMAKLSLGDINGAVPIARKMQADGLRSQVAQMVLLSDAVSHKDYDTVLKLIENERAVGPLVDGLTKGWALLGKGAAKQALEAFDEIGKEQGLAGFALYHKALALALVGDYEGAEGIFADQTGDGLQLTRRAVMARLQILSQLERNDQAIALMDELFGAELDTELATMRDRLVAGEVLPFDILRSANDGIAEVFLSVAKALSNEAGEDYVLVFSRVAEFLNPRDSDAILLSARLLEALGRYDLAVETYRKIPREDPSFYAAELGRAQALNAAGRTDAAAEVLEQLTRSHGQEPSVHVTLGDLMRQIKRHDKAVEAYTDAMELLPDPTEGQWFLYYARGISHERLGNWEQAEADFRASLAISPEQPQVLNYLGYSLVEKHKNLDEALDMIERAVAARPDSGFIVDSLGWVLYRLGRYEEAVGHMERAVELMPVDPVVNDHLGDVLWAVGRALEARFQWRRALSFVGTSESGEDVDPDRIRRKLEVGLDQVLQEEGRPPLAGRDAN